MNRMIRVMGRLKMGEIRVSMTTLRQNLGDLVNRAAYGGERIVLVSRGEPRAAIVSIADLRRLERVSQGQTTQDVRYARTLETADHIRERIQRWQEAHNIEPGDSAEILRQLREERGDELSGLR
jgi:prevent-host-death family protein